MRRMLLVMVLMATQAQAQEKAAEEKSREKGATVTGSVMIEGKVGNPKNVSLTPECAQLHGGLPLKAQDAVVDGKNRVKWAFVWISKGLEGRQFPVPTEKVLVDQVGCCYTPHVLGIRAGQTLVIRNSDPTLHNVHGLPFNSNPFNFAQPVKGQENEVKFANPEVMVKVKCDVHPFMSTWAGVTEHPFFAVTDDSGAFTIQGLPPGKYTLSCWQEAWTTKAEKGCEHEIEVKAGEAKTANFVLDKKKE
jgi:plastocyanin